MEGSRLTRARDPLGLSEFRGHHAILDLVPEPVVPSDRAQTQRPRGKSARGCFPPPADPTPSFVSCSFHRPTRPASLCAVVSCPASCAAAQVGIDLMFDKPSGRVRIEAIRDGTPAKTCEGLAVGDVLLAVNGDRARVGIVGQLRTWRSRGQGRASLRALKRARNSRPQLLRTHMATALPSRAKGAPRFARWRESPSLRPRGEWEE